MSPSSPTQSPELLIQDAVPADAAVIAKLGAATFAKSFAHSMPAEHLQAYLEEAYTLPAISKELASKQCRFFVARLKPAFAGERGEVVGFIQMKLGSTDPCIAPDVPVCEVNRIYVSADHSGGGIGQSMMERGLNWARDQLLGSERLGRGVEGDNESVKKGRAAVWLGVWEENVKAQRFYGRWGFETVGTHDFVMGGTKQTDLVMVKWL